MSSGNRDQGLVKSAGVVSLAISLSRITGLLRESVLSWLFGATAVFDAYVLGVRIPMLARELFAEGALSAAFIPTFTRYQTTKGDAAARELSNITATLTMAIVGSLCVAGMVAAPLLVDLFAPGFHATPGKWELAVTLTRIMFPFLLFVSLAAQAQGILNANHQFGLPAVSSGVFNLVSVAGGLAIGHFTSLGSVYGMAIGVLLGGAAQVAFHLPAVWRTGFAWRPRWNLQHEGVRQILFLMGPALLGSASGQINVLVNTNLAAGLRDAAGHVMNGPVSWLNYAFRFLQLPMGVFAFAIASATLPRMARSAAVANWPEFRETLSRSLIMIFLLTMPAAAGLIVLGESMIALVYQHGKFLPSDTHQTALALSGYALGLVGAASLRLITPAFYALGDSRTPMYVSLSSVAVNFVAVYSLVNFAGFGHVALALSAATVSTFTAITLLLLLRPRIGGIGGKLLFSSFARIAVAALATAAAAYLAKLASHRFFPGKTANIFDVAVGVPLGGIAFYFAATALRVPALTEARERILSKFRVGAPK